MLPPAQISHPVLSFVKRHETIAEVGLRQIRAAYDAYLASLLNKSRTPDDAPIKVENYCAFRTTQPAVRLFDRSEGNFPSREQVTNREP